MTTREAASILWSAVTWLLGLLIVACYLLPHTLLATMLGFNRIDTIAFGALQMGSYLVVVGAFLAVLSWWWSIARRSSETSILLALIALYALALTADAFYVASVPTLLRQYSLVISSLGIGLLAARLCGTTERILALLSTVGTIGAIYGLYYYTHRLGVVVSGTVVRAGGLYAAPLEFSYVLMVCLPCAIYWLIRTKRPLGMVAGMIATVTILASLLLTFSRMALAASALAAVFALVRHKRPRRSTITYVVAVLIVCAAVVACRMVGTENIHSSTGSGSAHLEYIGMGLQAFTSHPLTGVGLGNIRSHSDASDLLVQWIAEMGIGGGLLLVALIVALIRCLRRHSALATAISAAFMAMGLAGLTDVPFGTVDLPASTCVIGMLVGATMALVVDRNTYRPAVVDECNHSAPNMTTPSVV